MKIRFTTGTAVLLCTFSNPMTALWSIIRRYGRCGLPPAWLVDVSQLDYPGMADRDELTKLSVKELKSFLFYRDASLSGSKQLLAERVEQAIRDEQEAGSGPLGAPEIGAPVSAAAATP